jgi:hypothetical protein
MAKEQELYRPEDNVLCQDPCVEYHFGLFSAATRQKYKLTNTREWTHTFEIVSCCDLTVRHFFFFKLQASTLPSCV